MYSEVLWNVLRLVCKSSWGVKSCTAVCCSMSYGQVLSEGFCFLSNWFHRNKSVADLSHSVEDIILWSGLWVHPLNATIMMQSCKTKVVWYWAILQQARGITMEGHSSVKQLGWCNIILKSDLTSCWHSCRLAFSVRYLIKLGVNLKSVCAEGFDRDG